MRSFVAKAEPRCSVDVVVRWVLLSSEIKMNWHLETHLVPSPRSSPSTMHDTYDARIAQFTSSEHIGNKETHFRLRMSYSGKRLYLFAKEI